MRASRVSSSAGRQRPVLLPRPRTPLDAARRAVVVGPRPMDPSVAVGAALAGVDLVSFELGEATDVLEHFDVAVLVVDTAEGRLPTAGYLEAAADTVARFLLPGATVVLASTAVVVPEALGTDLLRPVLEARSGLTAGMDFELHADLVGKAFTVRRRATGTSSEASS